MAKANGVREVKFSNLGKIYFPESGTTKGEMLRYYVDVAPYLLPHLKNRPVTLIRFPDGVKGESFYEKNAPAHAPEWIQTFAVPRQHHEGEINYILINDAHTLAWCANSGAIELHPFLHRVPEIDRPTHIAFDLDPGEGADLVTCAEAAFLVKKVMDGLGLEAFPKVSGSKGLQLYVPLNTTITYEAAQPFAKSVAELLQREHPKLIVSEMSKALRKNRVMIDWSQNSRSKTTVAVYSMRGKRPSPFVSMPVTWKELERLIKTKKIDTLFFSPEAALLRLKKLGDLFAPILTLKQRLPSAFMKSSRTSKTIVAPTEKAEGSLRAYKEKRDFSKTAEPAPEAGSKADKGKRRFVIQKHAASHLHYDFRLEMGGTLKSWAIPKGFPTELGVKRSAFATEDHPLEYLKFEGTIPQGQYGGGTVMVWDIGTYEVIEGDYWKGKLSLILKGKKLKGEWHLFRIRSEDEKPVWLVIKAGVPVKPFSKKVENSSVLTGRSMERIAKDNDAQWQSNR